MSAIKDKILSDYGIDIKEDNILSLYKIDNADITKEQLEQKISERRKRWNQSINGANEKFAERDAAYLEKAEAFEKILRNKKLLNELFKYYKGRKETDAGVSKRVKKFFGLVCSTKKVGRAEVDFYLKYFPDDKKNRKEIIEYLKREYKVIIAAVGAKDSEDSEEEEIDSRKQHKAFIVNLFAERTLLMLRKCENNFLESREKDVVRGKYPNMASTLYKFLELDKHENIGKFKEYVDNKRKEIHGVRNDFGSDFISLIDLFNGLSVLTESADIRDNFEEFKLLVMYPGLTPYMYAIGEMKKESLNTLYSIAREEYAFSSISDFLLRYFNIIYDNFGIYEESVRRVMDEANKKAGKERQFSKVYSFFKRRKGELSFKQRIIYILSYFPIHIFNFLFNIIKFIIEKLRYFGIGLAITTTVLLIVLGKDIYGDSNLFTNGLPWGNYLHELNGLKSSNKILGFISSLEAVIKIFFMYFAAGGVIGHYLWKLSVSLRKRIDLKGIERSMDVVIDNARKHLIEQGEDYPRGLLKVKLPIILVNTVSIIVILVLTVAIIK